MDQWVIAFVGDHARENQEITQRTNTFCVCSNRTPIRRAKPGDRVLFYLAGKGFVGRAEISSPAHAPVEPPEWSSKDLPMWQSSVENLHAFPEPISYAFPGDGNHPVLGFHRFSLTSGFLSIPESGFHEVLAHAEGEAPVEKAVPEGPAEVPVAKKEPTPANTFPEYRPPAARPPVVDRSREREKRMAGQYALTKGRRQFALWTVVETVASTLNFKGIERSARGRARAAEKTWIAGGRAEERVGEELEGLRAHGFYVFHDVPLPGVGNVDHVVLGEGGFFAIETKSHAGRVTESGGKLLRNGRAFEGDFVNQAWSGCYRLRGILDAEVVPLLLFTNAFVEGRITARGVRVLPLKWASGEILKPEHRHEPAAVKAAVARLSAATGCHPSAAPRPA